MYEINERIKANAKRLNLSVKPSVERNKKIDVFRNDKKIGSVGLLGYKDYPTYIKEKGLIFANKRRDLYKIRHKKDIVNGNGKLAYQLLWS